MLSSTFNPTLWQTIKAAIIQKPDYNWLTIPATVVQAIDIGSPLNGYHQVIQFNFSCTGNFCINLPLASLSLSQCLMVVRYRDGNTCVARRLTRDATYYGQRQFGDGEYTGQIIKKNASFEVWLMPGFLDCSFDEITIPISIKSFPAVENCDLTVVTPTIIQDVALPFVATFPTANDYWLDNV